MAEVTEAEDGALETPPSAGEFLRSDEAEPFDNLAAVMENMPCEDGNFLRVPKVGEEEG